MKTLPSSQRRLLAVHRSRWRCAATAVEFALTGPVLFLVVFVSVEFARISMMRNLAQNAAYEAARFVISEGATRDEAISMAQDILDRLGTQQAIIEINDGQDIDFNTEVVTIDIEIPMEANAYFFPMAYRDKNIVAQVTMYTERYKGYYDGDGDVNN